MIPVIQDNYVQTVTGKKILSLKSRASFSILSVSMLRPLI